MRIGVGEGLVVGDGGQDGLFGQGAVPDLAAAGAPQEAHLADRERREVVMEHEPLLGLLAQAVEPLGVLDRAEGDRGQALGLAAGEEGRAVGPGEEADLDRDGPDLVEAPAVGPLSLGRG